MSVPIVPKIVYANAWDPGILDWAARVKACGQEVRGSPGEPWQIEAQMPNGQWAALMLPVGVAFATQNDRDITLKLIQS